jgi:glycerol kinase
VRDSSGVFGTTSKEWLGAELPIAGMAGDQQASLFGQGCFEPGSLKNTYGTGCFLLMNTGPAPRASETGLLTTLAWGLDGRVEYALEGSVFVAGAAIQWLRDGLELFEHAADSEALATSVEDTGGVYFVPALTGLGAPYWDEHARGTIVGLTRGTTRAHLVRAALESIAFGSRDVVDCMARDAGLPIERLKVDGGACQNDFLMQFQADLLGATVERPSVLEVTAFGSAALAGLAVGLWSDRDDLLAKTAATGGTSFSPLLSADERDQIYSHWKRAVERSRDWHRGDA